MMSKRYATTPEISRWLEGKRAPLEDGHHQPQGEGTSLGRCGAVTGR
ncbi:hypothetical protein ACLOBP_07705 [Limosilactobacillus fermentum]